MLKCDYNVAIRQAGGSHIYCEAKQAQVHRLCSDMYVVLFQTTLTRDACSDRLSIPGTILPCAVYSCFRSFEPPFRYFGPAAVNDDLNRG